MRHWRPPCALGTRPYAVNVSSTSAYHAQLRFKRSSSINIAVGHVHARRVDAKQRPGEIAATGTFGGNAGDHRRAAGAAMHPGVGQKIALSLKTNAERRGDPRVARHRQVMQIVMKPQWKADDQHGGANFDLIQFSDQMGGCKRRKNNRFRQSLPVNLDSDDVDRAAGIDALAPQRLISVIKRNRPLDHISDVLPIHVELDGEPVRPVIAGLIHHDVSAGHEK